MPQVRAQSESRRYDADATVSSPDTESSASPPASRTTSADNHRGDAVLTDAALGGMTGRSDRTIWLVVHGDPKSQGSMVAVAPGRVKVSDPTMYAWRDNITGGEALRELGVQWRPIDGPPALIDVAFTMPFPPRSFEDQTSRIAPAVVGELPRIPAMQPPRTVTNSCGPCRMRCPPRTTELTRAASQPRRSTSDSSSRSTTPDSCTAPKRRPTPAPPATPIPGHWTVPAQSSASA